MKNQRLWNRFVVITPIITFLLINAVQFKKKLDDEQMKRDIYNLQYEMASLEEFIAGIEELLFEYEIYMKTFGENADGKSFLMSMMSQTFYSPNISVMDYELGLDLLKYIVPLDHSYDRLGDDQWSLRGNHSIEVQLRKRGSRIYIEDLIHPSGHSILNPSFYDLIEIDPQYRDQSESPQTR